MKTIQRFKKDKEKFLSETAVVSIVSMVCLTLVTVLLILSSTFAGGSVSTSASLSDTTGTQTIIQGDYDDNINSQNNL